MFKVPSTLNIFNLQMKFSTIEVQGYSCMKFSLCHQTIVAITLTSETESALATSVGPQRNFVRAEYARQFRCVENACERDVWLYSVDTANEKVYQSVDKHFGPPEEV